MSSTVKNVIAFLAIGTILVLLYVFFIRSPSNEATLIAVNKEGGATALSGATSSVSADFLSLLLNVKNIKLNDTILADMAFTSLRDSSITLTPSGNEGRVNPFAPIGSDPN